jgi:hypothetical protein
MKSKLRKWIRHIAPARHVRDEAEPRPAVEGTGRYVASEEMNGTEPPTSFSRPAR